MCLIAEVLVPLSALPFGQSVAQYDLELELEQTIPLSDDATSYVWARGPDAAVFRDAIESSLGPDEVTLVQTVPNGALYGSNWDPRQSGLLAALDDHGTVLLECSSSAETWRLRLRVPSHSDLSALRVHWANNGIEAEFDRITPLAADEAPLSEGLTESQREALLLALELGYFDEHRRTSLDELGAELDISRQAVAARLRRAYRTLAERIRDESP
ncbi:MULTISPECIES: helix-turn-helix domain-containing protein [Haloferax]|uniref:DNA-binding protein n=2 Tax=Haloferax TaxID=2251 RepID=A0A6G1Z5V0_9EURY|nr:MULTISPECIES: helix-turn-helix domain-containing protein [Haloferax]KAB1189147.1 DNA-binding protein [Haloferax sp. CBA1149]MRW81883.1 DNA-binding protein [Haloferax marinisediminis]